MYKKILITGTTGFVGSNLYDFLNKLNYDIIRSSRNKDKINEKNYIYLDLYNIIDLKDLLVNIDCVIHCSGIAHSKEKNKDKYLKINCYSTINLFNQCIKYKVKKFIFISSINVAINQILNNQKINSTSHIDENSFYNYSKYLAEKELINISVKNNSRIQLDIIRPSLIYGYKMKGNLVQLIKLIEKNYPLPFKSFENKISILYIENLCIFISNILQTNNSKKNNYNIFNLEDSETLPLQKLVKIIKFNLKSKSIIFNFNKYILCNFFTLMGKKSFYKKLSREIIIDDKDYILYKKNFLTTMTGINNTLNEYKNLNEPKNK